MSAAVGPEVGAAGHALSRWGGPILLVAGLLVLWQLLYLVVGDVALRSPLQTMRFTIELIGRETFWPNLTETAKAFAVALVISIVLGGSTTPATASTPAQFSMPAFGWRLSDQEIADVASFVRSSWGNRATPVEI